MPPSPPPYYAVGPQNWPGNGSEKMDWRVVKPSPTKNTIARTFSPFAVSSIYEVINLSKVLRLLYANHKAQVWVVGIRSFVRRRQYVYLLCDCLNPQ